MLVEQVKPKLVFELARYRGQLELLAEIEAWEVPVFPVTGKNLIKDAGIKPGKQMGATLRAVKDLWIASRFTLPLDKLLEHAKAVHGSAAPSK